jgi:hypothetical protein
MSVFGDASAFGLKCVMDHKNADIFRCIRFIAILHEASEDDCPKADASFKLDLEADAS